MKLSNIKTGQKAIITIVNTDDLAAGRLMEMGFSQGTEITRVLNSMSKNLSAYRVKNTVISIRNDTADKIKVSLIFGG